MQHRTYLWLYLAMEEIREAYQNSRYPDRVVIDALPQSVDEAYERLLQRVSHRQQPNARQVLLIIVGARRPLTLGEMAWAPESADAYQTQAPLLTVPNTDHLEKQIRNWCGLFVYIQHSTLYLIHQTAKEFLLLESSGISTRTSLWEGCLLSARVEFEMAALCVTYVCDVLKSEHISDVEWFLGDNADPQSEDTESQSPDADTTFFKYCIEFWPVHARSIVFGNSLLWDKVLTLYEDLKSLYPRWLSCLWRYHAPWSNFVPNMPGQHIAALNGHQHVLEYFYNKNGFDLEEVNGESTTLLYLAVSEGHYDVSRWLLDRNANVNNEVGHLGSVLTMASSMGDFEIVRLLLEYGADIDREAGEFGSALAAASFNGFFRVVQLLVEKGAPMYGPRCTSGHPLEAATQSNSLQIVQFLIDRGADVNATGSYDGGALVVAAKHGHTEIAQLLIDRGADIEAFYLTRYNALQLASSKGHTKLVKLLLDSGANVEARPGQEGNALQAALQAGHTELVQLLIDRGADVNSPGGCYGRALQTASVFGHTAVVQLLIDHGADVNSCDANSEYRTALQAASYGGYVDVVQLLLDSGAHIESPGRDFEKPIQAASAAGNLEVVRLLLSRGADFNNVTDPRDGPIYGLPLQVASYGGHTEVVRLLIQAGARIDAQSKPFGSALTAAVFEVHEETNCMQIVCLLLRSGADISIAEESCGDLVEEASNRGKTKVAKLLKKWRAKSPLQCSAQGQL